MSMCLTNKFLPLLIPLTSSISYALCSNGYYICLRKEREKMLPFSPTGLESSPLPGSYALIEESLERNLPRVLMKRKPGVQVDREARPLLEAV